MIATYAALTSASHFFGLRVFFGGLKQHGLQILDVDAAPFKAALAKTDYYKTWRGKFGDQAWKLLQDHAGSLT